LNKPEFGSLVLLKMQFTNLERLRSEEDTTETLADTGLSPFSGAPNYRIQGKWFVKPLILDL
jgi:hypothetical protein